MSLLLTQLARPAPRTSPLSLSSQTLTYRTKQKDDLKHMDKLSLHVLTACTGAAAAPAAGAGAGAGATARKAAPGSGAQRKRAAAEARLAAGKSAVGARTLARQQAKAQREAQRRSRRQERREERLLAGGGSSAAAL